MKKVLHLSAMIALVLAANGGVARAQSAQPDSLYRGGRSAVTAGDYRKAATMFGQLADKYPASKNLGDALYWRAYSLVQLGSASRSSKDYADALSSLDRYGRVAGKNAPLATDVADLRGRIRAAQAKLGDAEAAGDVAKSAKSLAQSAGCAGSQADEETRVAALEGLLSMNSEDAVPILKEVLKRRDACRVDLRRKAVWMISQKEAPDVATTLLDVARNDPNLDVRTDAVFWLSQTRSEKVIPMLDSILFSAGDDQIRKKAIFSLSQQMPDERAAQALRRAVEDERLPADLRGEAVFWLGNTPSNANLEYFKSVFKKTTNTDLRAKIVQAVSNTPTPEAANWLLDVARDKSYDVDTRKNALFWAGQRKSFDVEQLSSIYSQAGDDEIKNQVLFVYSQRREAAATDRLMTIAKSDPDVQMRKKALFWLGQRNDPRVKQFILDLINKP
jgi:HEAT repeat protein